MDTAIAIQMVGPQCKSAGVIDVVPGVSTAPTAPTVLHRMQTINGTKHVYVTGAAVGLNTLPGLQFDKDASYTGCLICGELYQSKLDRKVLSIEKDPNHPLRYLLPSYTITANRLRKEWARNHSKRHTDAQHAALKAAGQFCTPEAALKLTPVGVFPLDHVNTDSAGDEIASAMLEAKRAPQNDAQGSS